jgi:6-phosphogluconolactonase
MQIDVFETAEMLAAAAGELFFELAHKAIGERGRFDALLSGGSTPRAVYQWLAEHGDMLDWQRVRLFFGDERPVPPDHADSNYRMAKEAMLDALDHYGVRAYRIEAEWPPHEAAARYEATLKTMFSGDFPRFDLAYLGLGTDAHTASLFPNTRAIHEEERWFVANEVQPDEWRITATPPVINNARQIAFLVTGASKAEPVQQVIEGERLINIYPAQIVAPYHGHVRWMLDQAAASRLRRSQKSGE